MRSRVLATVAAVVLLFFAWAVSRGWDASILDVHEFRQLQTATSIHWAREEGPHLAYSTPLFGPPWSVPMEFPLYQWVVAGTSQLMGTPLEPTARGVSVAFFLLGLAAVAMIAGELGLDRTGRWFVAATVATSPLYLFYARTVLIETTALSCALWFLAAVLRTRTSVNWGWAMIALTAGGLAALAKVTTFLIFCLPVLALIAWRCRTALVDRKWNRAPLLSLGSMLSALALGWAWVKWSDIVKLSNPFASALTSDALAEWNWGSWHLRTSAKFWTALSQNLTRSILSEASLAALVIAAACASRRTHLLLAAGAACFVAAPLLFATLFTVHDYYYCANAVLLLGAAGVALARLWANEAVPLGARSAVLVVFFVGQWVAYHVGYADYARRNLPEPPSIAAVIRELLPGEDVLVIYGWDWNSLIPYYAQRRALMIPGTRECDFAALDSILTRMPPHRIGAMLVRPSGDWHTPEFVRDRAEQFGLFPAPVARSEAGELYVRADLLGGASDMLRTRAPTDVILNEDLLASPRFSRLPPWPSELLTASTFLSPVQAARGQFGASWGEMAGHASINTHAPCEVVFTAQPHTAQFTADFNLPEATYHGDEITDGVGVQIWMRNERGEEHLLVERFLDPANISTDRGLQHLEIAGPFSGRIVLRVTPGPADSTTKDWFCLVSAGLR